jgi:Holliday junction resolvase
VSTPSKRKGSQAERDVVKFLQVRGWIYAERRLAGDTNDRGDVAGVNGVCIEIKNHAKMNLAGWIEELEVEIINAKANTGVVIHKRKGKSDVAQWYATMTVELYVELLKEAGYDEKKSTRKRTED